MAFLFPDDALLLYVVWSAQTGGPLFRIGPPIAVIVDAPAPISVLISAPAPIVIGADVAQRVDYPEFPAGEARSIPLVFSGGALPCANPALVFTIRDPSTGIHVIKKNAAAGGSELDLVTPPLDGSNIPTGQGFANLHASDTTATTRTMQDYDLCAYDPADFDGTNEVLVFGKIPIIDHASL